MALLSSALAVARFSVYDLRTKLAIAAADARSGFPDMLRWFMVMRWGNIDPTGVPLEILLGPVLVDNSVIVEYLRDAAPFLTGEPLGAFLLTTASPVL